MRVCSYHRKCLSEVWFSGGVVIIGCGCQGGVTRGVDIKGCVYHRMLLPGGVVIMVCDYQSVG